LTLGALRKYQYKFRLQMGQNEKPLLTRSDLIDAIRRHFTQEMTCDYNEEIGKFLSFKREDLKPDLYLPTRRQPNRNRGSTRNTRPNQNNTVGNLGASNGMDSSSGNSGTPGIANGAEGGKSRAMGASAALN